MFSKTVKYAIRAVLCLAANRSPNNKAKVDEISSKLEVPTHFLAKILQTLARNKIISSAKGPGGGFYLTEENLNLPLLKVIEVFDGSKFFDECVLGLKECSSKNPCPLHEELAVFKLNLYNLIGYQTISKISQKVKDGKMSI